MRTKTIFGILLCTIILITGCNKDNNDDNANKTGVLKFKMINPNSPGKKSINFKSASSNPTLVGDSTGTILIGIKACVGDIWVSQGQVTAGQPDNHEWIRLTEVTNTQLLTFEDYSFAPKDVPVGIYRSIKISLKNIFYWQTELLTNSNVKYELLQTMGSSLNPCYENDTSWIKPDYFSADGNHRLNDIGLFELVAPDEKVGGFTIEAGKTAIVNWRWLMSGCIFNLLDLNQNLIFDCGIDDIEATCPNEYMFDFVVEYE